MYKLRGLNAEGSNIYGSLKSLDKSLSLISVNLSNSGIEDISGIHYLKNLKYLDLRNNKINGINMLQYLQNLETLYLKGNPIYDYSPVKGYYDKLVNKDFEL